jgi:D-amino peptidase
LFLGYHAKFGTEKSTFDHTYSGASINKVEINGTAVSEFLFNAYVAGEFNVPVIMVAGEAKLIVDDVKPDAPWVETVALKQSLSRVSARSPSMKQIEKELRDAATRAAASHSQGKPKLLTAKKPTNIKITFQNSRFADVAESLPEVKRESGLEIEYVANDILEAQKIFELLTYAGAGITSLLESQR